MEQEKSKMMQASDVLSIIAKIGFWVSIVLVALEAIGLCYIALDIDKFKDLAMKLIKLANQSESIANEDAAWNPLYVTVATGISSLVVASAFSIKICANLSRFFCNIKKDGTPFSIANVKILKSISISLIIFVIISAGVTNAVGNSIASSINTIYVFGTENYFGELIGIVFFYAASVIFHYGCKLEHK